MGIYDRDYYREQRPLFSLAAPQTIIGKLILINVVIWVADGLLCSQTHWLTGSLAVTVGTLSKPWLWWKLLTYAFAHSPTPEHILFNMLTLWIFGADVEAIYGRKEILRLYLVLVIAGSLVWAISSRLLGAPENASLIGASGAVTGIVLLFVLHYPRRTILLMFVLPVPAWLLGVLLVGGDLLGAMHRAGQGNVAYGVHLTGAALAFLYFHFGWNFGRLIEGRFAWPRLWRRPRLRIHNPEIHSETPQENQQPDLGEQVDRILEKIHREGEASLTRSERRLLETASREYQKRRRGRDV